MKIYRSNAVRFFVLTAFLFSCTTATPFDPYYGDEDGKVVSAGTRATQPRNVEGLRLFFELNRDQLVPPPELADTPFSIDVRMVLWRGSGFPAPIDTSFAPQTVGGVYRIKLKNGGFAECPVTDQTVTFEIDGKDVVYSSVDFNVVGWRYTASFPYRDDETEQEAAFQQ